MIRSRIIEIFLKEIGVYNMAVHWTARAEPPRQAEGY